MATSPQLPAGYKLDAAAAASAPKLPMGYKLDAPPPSDQFAQDRDTVDKWAEGHSVLGPAARFLVAGGQNAANAITGTPGFVYHSIVDPASTSEGGLTYPQRVAGRLTGLTSAIEGWTDPEVKVTPKSALSVLPEALGTGFGQTSGGAVYGKLGEATKVGAGELNRVVPSTTRSGKGLNALEQTYETHPTTANRLLAETGKIEQELGTVGANLPPPLAYLRDRLQAIDAMRSQGLPWDEFTFKEARTALKQLNNHIDFSNPNPNNALYRRAAGALSQDIMESTAQPSAVAPEGFQADYQRMIDETRRGNKAIRTGEKVGPVAGALAGYSLGREMGAPMGAEFLMGVGGKLIGRSVAGSLMRSIIEREGGPPNISAPPAPPSGAAPPVGPPPVTAAPMPPPTPPSASPAPSPVPVGAAASELEGNRLFMEQNALRRTKGVLRKPPSAESGGLSPVEESLWQQSVFGEKPVEDVGTKVRAANPEPTRAEVKAAATQVKQSPAPPTTSNIPGYIQDTIDQQNALAERLGIADKIEELSAQGLVAKQITGRLADQFPKDMDAMDRSGLVRSVRNKRGIPSQMDEAEFNAWKNARGQKQSPTSSGGNPVRDTKILAQVQAEHPEWTISQQLMEAAKRAKVAPPPVPPKPIARNLPPEAYTRFLLAAKEGEITPGELERRFAKYGAGNVVRPLARG